MSYISAGLLFYTKDKKQDVSVGFSKKSFIRHQGIQGLKYYLVIMYLRIHLDTFGKISMTLADLMGECGYSTNGHNLSSYITFRNIIHDLEVNEYIQVLDSDVLTVKPTTFFKVQLSEVKNIFFSSGNFVLFTAEEYETITRANTSINRSVLAGVYLYIKQFITQDESMIEYGFNVAYPTKKAIAESLGLSSIRSIEAAIKCLSESGLIYISHTFFMEDTKNPGKFIPTRNIYGLSPKYVSDENCIAVLEDLYGKKIYRKNDISIEKIKYLHV